MVKIMSLLEERQQNSEKRPDPQREDKKEVETRK
jgi:hypothetical protein